MRVKLQLVISHDDGHEETVTDIITLNKNHQRIEHLGLSLAESKQLLSTLQRHLLQQQLTTFLDTHATESMEILGVRPPAVSPQSSCPGPDTSA
jgi:hypothetical protein